MAEQQDKAVALAERLAAALSPIDEIAQVLEVPVTQLQAEVKAQSTLIARAIARGWLLTRVACREAVIKQALNGSSPAQAMVAEMMKRSS